MRAAPTTTGPTPGWRSSSAPCRSRASGRWRKESPFPQKEMIDHRSAGERHLLQEDESVETGVPLHALVETEVEVRVTDREDVRVLRGPDGDRLVRLLTL